MRDAMAAEISGLGAEPEIDVVLDDSWSTDRITPLGREKLRAAGFPPDPASDRRAAAPPAPARDVPLPLLRLGGDAPGEHLRPNPVPLASLLRGVPAAVRAVQDDLRE